MDRTLSLIPAIPRMKALRKLSPSKLSFHGRIRQKTRGMQWWELCNGMTSTLRFPVLTRSPSPLGTFPKMPESVHPGVAPRSSKHFQPFRDRSGFLGFSCGLSNTFPITDPWEDCTVYLPSHEWLIFMANVHVGKYTIHGWYGFYVQPDLREDFFDFLTPVFLGFNDPI